MSTSGTRTLEGSIRSPSRLMTVPISSESAPEVSTPVGPPPTTTKLSDPGAVSAAASASSSELNRRLRNRRASARE